MEVQGVFLLGGHDLEMNTIAKLLEERHLIYKDRSLQWHDAYLSQYKQDILSFIGKPQYQMYGIELQEDISLPNNYTRIDHHNRYAGLPSALEQVALLLNCSLNRYQKLVAANDKGYIPGMKSIGATPEEIQQIRLEDRKAQGVTEEDEILAEKAIENNKEILADLVIVRAYTSRFSPICDRLYPYERLLIYTDQELMYYGKDSSLLVDRFVDRFSAGHMFCGGGKDGYLGTKRGAYLQEELQQIINQIKTHIL